MRVDVNLDKLKSFFRPLSDEDDEDDKEKNSKLHRKHEKANDYNCFIV